MKMVVAYLDPERFETVREELLAQGMGTLSLMSATGSVPEATLSGSYRGTPIEGHSRSKARLECIVGDDHAATVVDVVLKNGGERSFVFVVAVEQAFPTETVMTDEVLTEAG
jgi:nitrogen regulatory protein PII